MRDRILAVIAGARSRLNAVIVAHRALAWAIPSSAVAALAAAALRLAGADWAGLALWAILLALGAGIGAARGLASRMGTADAARWLDGRLGDDELLSAALVCIARGRSGPFDDLVLSRAEAQAGPASALRPPLRPIARKAALATAASMACALALVLARPIDPAARGVASTADRAAAVREARTGSRASGDEIREAASALAASLFPEDKRMATLAQRALREGRLDDFRDIVKGADVDLSSRLERSVSELEKKRLTRERDRLRDAASAVLSRAAAATERGAEGREGGAGASGDEDGEAGGYPGGAGSPGPGAGGEGGDPYPGEGGTGGSFADGSGVGPGGAGAGGSGGSSGEGWGEGSGAPKNWGEVEPEAGGGLARVDLSDDASFFEIVLPGEDAAAPIADLLPRSSRAAESAMSRRDLPLEYRDFVRSYFMALSKGASE